MCLRVCVCVCVRACVRVFVRACEKIYIYIYIYICGRAGAPGEEVRAAAREDLRAGGFKGGVGGVGGGSQAT